MPDVINLNSAQQRHKDREMLESIRHQKENLRKVMDGLERLERDLQKNLGINPDGGDAA
ncbi:hypothetical protein [Atlantibacter hermannii]|uniref:hypothetical protein n=1 Tax=Atlantibacter hermannii TaxID=565 RepID=UPI0028A0F4BF|nr:hypothetical protein [Atlantibacter hermannii]